MSVVILKYTDFDYLPYNVPSANSDTFLKFMVDTQQECLILLLGLEYYNSFIDALALLPDEWVVKSAGYNIDDLVVYGKNIFKSLTNANNTIPSTTDIINWELVEENNKWLALLKGDTYHYLNRPYVWKGIVELLKPFVYAEYLKATFDNHAKTGINIAKIENGTLISASQRIARGRRAFNDLVGNATHWWPFQNWRWPGKASLATYLLSLENVDSGDYNSTDYTTWQAYVCGSFQPYGSLNEFNL